MTTLGGPLNLDGVNNRSDEQKAKKLPADSVFQGSQPSESSRTAAYESELREEYAKLSVSVPSSGSSSSDSGSDGSDGAGDDEGSEGYRPGGYHRVSLGDRFKGRQYEVLRKLGWGHFSTVWLARDSVRECDVALKVVKSARNYTEAAMDEIKILKTISKNAAASRHYVIDLLDHFFHIGPNGTHVVMVFEVLGKSLLSAVRDARYRGLPPIVVQRVAHQVLVGLEFLQTKCGVVHTDLKPENVLLTPVSDVLRAPEAVEVRIVDFGNACWVDKHFTDNIQTRQYRSIEALLGINYGPPCDVWSLACILFELATGDFLFEPRDGDEFAKDDDHLAQMIETLGAIPKRVALSGRHSRNFFSSAGELRRIRNLQPWPLERVLLEKYKWKADEAAEFAALLRSMLTYNPLMRPSASELLRHKWLKRRFAEGKFESREKGERMEDVRVEDVQEVKRPGEAAEKRLGEEAPEKKPGEEAAEAGAPVPEEPMSSVKEDK